METGRKVILYIAMSLDGYIAQPNDDLSFLSMVEEEGEDYGYAKFMATIDSVIIGRRTYDKVLAMGYGFPHRNKDTYILTRTPRPALGSVKFYTGDLKDLVVRLKEASGKHIFVDGGAQVVHQLLQDDLVDELYISIIPILLGDGIPLFSKGRPEVTLHLVDATPFDKGLVQLHYINQHKAYAKEPTDTEAIAPSPD